MIVVIIPKRDGFTTCVWFSLTCTCVQLTVVNFDLAFAVPPHGMIVLLVCTQVSGPTHLTECFAPEYVHPLHPSPLMP